MTDTPARRERDRLCDLLVALGPDAPTLCEGWTTRDLAAHLVVREHRPDVMGSLLLQRFGAHRDRVRVEAATQPFDDLLATLRAGAPAWNPAGTRLGDELANTTEFYVHHEDVRRAQPDWSARDLDADLADRLDADLAKRGRLLGGRVSYGILLWPDDRAPILLKRAMPTVQLRGPIGELVLLLSGRGEHAHVTVDLPDGAPEDLAEHLRTRAFSI